MRVSLRSQTRLSCSLCLLLAACGGAPSDPAATPAEPGAAEPAPVVPAPAPTPAPEPAAAEPSAVQPEPVPAAPAADAPAAKADKGATPAAPGAEPAAATPTAQPKAAAAVACGEDGQPRCPLQAFMEDEVDKPLESGDLEQVAAALTKVAIMAPDPAWNAGGAKGFRGMAEASAAAARANDVPALQQGCKTCHKAFRRKYKDEFRSRPLP
jgi:hypothetical protein